MSGITLSEIVARQQAQQEVLLELIEIALRATRESSDSSVAVLHLITRLNKLADSLKQTPEAMAAAQRQGGSALHH